MRLCLARVVTPRLTRAICRPPYFRPYGAQACTRAVSASARISVPRFWRIYLLLWLIRRWRLPATPCLSLPLAVTVKRFFTPLLVLSLGIFVSLLRSLARRYPTATACLPAGPLVFQRSGKRAPIEAAASEGNRLPGNLGPVSSQKAARLLDCQAIDQRSHR